MQYNRIRESPSYETEHYFQHVFPSRHSHPHMGIIRPEPADFACVDSRGGTSADHPHRRCQRDRQTTHRGPARDPGEVRAADLALSEMAAGNSWTGRTDWPARRFETLGRRKAALLAARSARDVRLP